MSTLSMITINLHCLEEQNIKEKQEIIANEIINRNADVVFLQEVAQYANRPIIFGDIKETNYGYELHQLLNEKGYFYEYFYTPIKHSFGKYDEGLGLMSKYPMMNVSFKYISKTTDYYDWHSRKYLKATIKLGDQYIDLFTTHLGWDSDKESYIKQCKRMVKNIDNPHTIIGGDFNVPYGESHYKKTIDLGLIDLYGKKESKKHDPTFNNKLDIHQQSARIDYIFATQDYKVLEQEIIFDQQRVSDHYGVYLKIEVK